MGVGGEVKIRVDSQLVFNNSYDVTDAALDGFPPLPTSTVDVPAAQ
jgi:hypothetical protein